MTLDLDAKIPQLQSPECVTNENRPLSFWSWREALLQHDWKIHVFPTDNQALNIQLVAHKLVLIQELFPQNKLIPVSWLRTSRYNAEIGGAAFSAHLQGMACDLIIENMRARDVRLRLSTELDRLDIRMERLTDQDGWVHIDLREPGPGGRYFSP